MPTTVEIPNVGIVDFPDEMSPEQITSTIRQKFSPVSFQNEIRPEPQVAGPVFPQQALPLPPQPGLGQFGPQYTPPPGGIPVGAVPDMEHPYLPLYGSLGDIVDATTPGGRQSMGTLGGYAMGVADQLSPVNIATVGALGPVFKAVEAAGATPIANWIKAALLGYFTTEGTKNLSSSLGERFSGVPEDTSQQARRSIGETVDMGMLLGGLLGAKAPREFSSGLQPGDIRSRGTVGDISEAFGQIPPERQIPQNIAQFPTPTQPAGGARFAVDPAGQALDLPQFTSKEQREAMRGPREFAPREEQVRPAQPSPTIMAPDQPLLPEELVQRLMSLTQQAPKLEEGTQALESPRIAKEETAGKVSFGAPAGADVIPQSAPTAFGIGGAQQPRGIIGDVKEAVFSKDRKAIQDFRNSLSSPREQAPGIGTVSHANDMIRVLDKRLQELQSGVEDPELNALRSNWEPRQVKPMPPTEVTVAPPGQKQIEPSTTPQGGQQQTPASPTESTGLFEGGGGSKSKGTKLYGGFFVLDPDFWSSQLGVAKNAKMDAQQLYNRVRNKLGEDSAAWEAVKDILPKVGKVTPDEARKIVEEKGPKVEVHSYGMEGKVSEAKREYDRMTHEWLENQPEMQANALYKMAHDTGMSYEEAAKRIDRLRELDMLTDEQQQKGKRYIELHKIVEKEPIDRSLKATSAYDTVSALPTNEPMPEWTKSKEGRNVQRVDVVLPQKSWKVPDVIEEQIALQKQLGGYETLQTGPYGKSWVEKPKWPPDSLHENLPNTIGWAMIQYKTVGDKKVAFIGEAQSRWGQRVREEDRLDPEHKLQQGGPGRQTPVNPLLRDYNRLILKAAIEQARKEGATHIVISDAETAMMTEGHDLMNPIDMPIPYSDAVAKDLQEAVGLDDELLQNYKERGQIDFDGTPEDVPLIQEVLKKHGVEWGKPPQEPGMRLHYDTILPKIAQELTGDKGEKVSLGEHKNVFEQNPAAGDYIITHPPIGEKGNYVVENKTTGETKEFSTWEEAHAYTDKALRKNLIFHNPDGTPKTDVSGLSFKIPPDRDWSLFGKDKAKAESPKAPSIGLGIKKAMEEGRGGEAGGGQAHEMVAEAVKKAWSVVESKGRELTDTLRGNYTRVNIAAKADAADNAAKQAGINVENHAKLLSTKLFGSQGSSSQARYASTKAYREAVPIILEVHGDRSLLAAAKEKVKNNPSVLRAVEMAEKNWDRLQPLVQDAKKIDEMNLGFAKKYNIDIEPLADYLKRIYEESSGRISQSTKQREFATLFDAVEAGKKPLSLDYAVLAGRRTMEIAREANKRWWINSFRDIKAAGKDEPVIRDLREQKKGTLVAPRGYVSMEMSPGFRVAVHEDYASIFNAILGRSRISGSLPGQIALQTVGTVKHGTLMFDSFHALRITQFGKSFDMGVGYKKGLGVLEYSSADLKEAERQGMVPKGTEAWANEKVSMPQGGYSRRQLLRDGITEGLNIGRHTEALYSDVIRKIPGIGTFNRFVFDKLSRGVMAEAHLSEVERTANEHPDWAYQKIQRTVARDINFRMGNIGRQGLFKSRQMQDLMQLAFLAPRWVEAMGQTEARSISQGVKALNPKSEQFLKLGSLARSSRNLLVAYVVGTQVLNYLTLGHGTWDNPEGHKLDAYLPPVKKGDRGLWISPLSVVAELTHDLVRYTHAEKSVTEAVGRVVSNKESPLLRGVWDVGIKGQDWKQNKIQGDWERIKQAAMTVADPSPLPLRGVAKAVKEGDTTPASRQTLATLGLKAEPETGKEARQRELETKGIKSSDIKGRLQEEHEYLSRRKPMASQDRADAAKRSIQQVEQRRGEITKALPKDVQEFVEKRHLSVLSYTPKLGVKEAKKSKETEIYLDSKEEKFFREKLVEKYTNYFHNVIPRFRSIPDEELQKIVSKDLLGIKKEAEQETLKAISSGLLLKQDGEKKKRFSVFQPQ